MTNNTINVPRELLENIVLCYNEGEFELGTLAAECHALLSAQSPAGVDGLEVVAWRIGFPNNSGYKVYEKRQPWAYEQYGVPSAIVYEVQELCRLSDAQAIIDGLRGENQRIQQELRLHQSQIESSGRIADRAQQFAVQLRAERDQHAQRIGELEGLLDRVKVSLSLDDTEWGYSAPEKYKLLADIRAALSAGKEKQDERS